MTTLWQDIRFGVRMLRKSPGFTATAVLSLALGIGAAATLFSVFDAVVLHPFPYSHPEQIAYVRSNSGQPLSAPDFKDIHEQNKSFVDLGVYRPTRLNFGSEKPESLPAIQCTAGVLRALDVKPALGRWIDEADEQPGAAPVTVISHTLWMRAFRGDPGVVGQMIRLDSRGTEVIGVMPAAFEFTSPWYGGHDYAVWTPLVFDAQQASERGSHWLLGIGRLRPGVDVATADAEIKAIGAQLTKAYPATNTRKPMLVRSIREEITREMETGMRPLAAAVAMLMLVACANVAGLLLARGAQRQGEFGLRLAMGASRGILLRQLLSEAILLGLIGSAVGILFAAWGVSAFRHLIPSALIIEARRAAIQINGRILLFAVILGLIAAILASLFPAFRAAATPVMKTLNDGGRTQTGSRLRHRFLRHLAVAQIAVAMALAHAGVLFTSSYVNVFRTNRMLNTDQVLSAEIVVEGQRYSDVGARVRFWNALIERIGALPGVQHVGVTTKLPLEGGNNFDVLVDDQAFDPTVRRPLVENSGASPDYFAAMGLGWLRGQPADFTSSRGSNIPIVINQAMARKCWPDADPMGRHARIDSAQQLFNFEVVGIVEDVRQWGAESSPMPEMYYACTLEATPEEALPNSAYVVIRAAGDTRALVPAVRHELAAVDSELPLANIRTMGDVLQGSTSGRRLSAGLINLFMAVTLLLTAVGMYGTLSFILQQRNREIGVRIAVGAQRRQIFFLVMKQAGLWLLGGLMLGLVFSVVCSFLVRSLVYAVSPLNPFLILLGAGLVAGVLCLACLAPALRAAKADPMMTLRCE
jgi:putative ABC transport system permease protein